MRLLVNCIQPRRPQLGPGRQRESIVGAATCQHLIHRPRPLRPCRFSAPRAILKRRTRRCQPTGSDLSPGGTYPMSQAHVERTVDPRPASTNPLCPVCRSLARSRCVCDGEWRLTLPPRPPVSNVWPRDLPLR